MSCDTTPSRWRVYQFHQLGFKERVPRTGLEPAHLAAPPPEDGASTNFAIWAITINMKLFVPVVFRTGLQIYNPYVKSACGAYIKFGGPLA